MTDPSVDNNPFETSKLLRQISIDSLSSSFSRLKTSTHDLEDDDDQLSDYMSSGSDHLPPHHHHHHIGHSSDETTTTTTTTTTTPQDQNNNTTTPSTDATIISTPLKCIIFDNSLVDQQSPLHDGESTSKSPPLQPQESTLSMENLKEGIKKELSDLELWSVGETNILALCECSLLYNHLTTANLIVTNQYLCFLPNEHVGRGIALESYLHIKSKGDYFWKKFWFVLGNGSLSWYRSSELKETYYPNGSIPLKKITAIHKLPLDGGLARPFCFQIITNSQMYLIQADNEVQLEQWYHEIIRLQRNLTVVLPLSEVVTIEMDVEAALFFDSVYITTKRGESFIVTPTSHPNEIYKLILRTWGKLNLKSQESTTIATDQQQKQSIEFQKIFKLNQRVNIIFEKTCLLYNDDISSEGTVFLTDDSLYFNSERGDSFVLIIPSSDIIFLQINPETDSPEAIKVVTKEYEVFYFDLIVDFETFFDKMVQAFTIVNPSIQSSKDGTDQDLKLKQQQHQQQSQTQLTKNIQQEGEKIIKYITSVIPRSLPNVTTRLFRSKSSSSASLNSTPTATSPPLSSSPPNNNNNNQNQTNIVALSPTSTPHSHRREGSNDHDKTIFINRNTLPNIQSELHQLFPSLPLNEGILTHQACSLYYQSTNTNVEGHIYVTKSYIAFAPLTAPSTSSSFHQLSFEEKKQHYMKALIPFDDVVSIKKTRYALIFKHCIKIITGDHKWIFGSLNNFYDLYRVLMATWTPSYEGIFTQLESVKIRQKLGLPTDEPLITWYNCTNFKGAQLKYGILYITKHFVCFRSKFGFQKRTIVIPFSSITSIKKYSGVLPNGLKITTTQQQIDFASFLHRGRVYRQLRDTWNENKSSITPTLYRSNGAPKIDLLQLGSPTPTSPTLPSTQNPNSSSTLLRKQMISQSGGYDPNLSSAPTSLVNTPKLDKKLCITILTIGSRGDIQPYIALSLALKNQGHRVILASHELYRSLISEEYGIEFRPLGGDPKELMDLCVRNGIFTPKFIREALSRFRQFIDDLLRTCWEAAQGAEALIATPGCFAGPHIAEALQIPFFHSFTMPFTRTRMYPNPFAPFANSQLGGVFNLATHMMMEKILWQPVSGQINQWRTETLGLPAWTSSVSINETYRLPYLYCFSKVLVPKPSDWGSEISITGNWFMSDAGRSEDSNPPPDELVQFIDSNPEDPPIYIGFGSIVIENPDEMSKIISEAVRLSGKRAIISQGWGGLKVSNVTNNQNNQNNQNNEKIYLLDKPVAHTWLFEKVQLVIHHGGAGTTAAGIIACKPSIIVPFFGDQFFWGGRIHEAGIGTFINSKTLSAKSLATSIIELTKDRDMLVRVQEMSLLIKNEGGLKNALESFNLYMPISYVPPLKQASGSVSACAGCKQPFKILNQMVPLLQTRFHCNACGRVFCEKCVSNKIPLPKYRMNLPVRVCDDCHTKITKENNLVLD